MLSMLGLTSLELSEQKKQELIGALNAAGKTVFPDFYLSMRFAPEEFSTESVKNLIQCAAIVHDDVTLDQKRAFSRVMQDATAAQVEGAKFIVLFWETAKENIYC